MWESGEQLWCCPFCQHQTIKVFFRKSFRKQKAIRGSGQSGTKPVRTNSELTVLSESCSFCGKTKKEIEPKLLY
jgi:hypothetical protein